MASPRRTPSPTRGRRDSPHPLSMGSPASTRRSSNPPSRSGSLTSQRKSSRSGSFSSQPGISPGANKSSPEAKARYYVGRMRMHLEHIGQMCVLAPELLTTEILSEKIDKIEENFAIFIRICADYKLIPYTAAFDNKLAMFRYDVVELLEGEEGALGVLIAADTLMKHLFYICRHGWAEILYSDQDFYFLVKSWYLPFPSASEKQVEPPPLPGALTDVTLQEGWQMENPTHVRTGQKPWWSKESKRSVVYEDAALRLCQDDVIQLPGSWLDVPDLDDSKWPHFKRYFQVKGVDKNKKIIIAKGEHTNSVPIEMIKRVWCGLGNE